MKPAACLLTFLMFFGIVQPVLLDCYGNDKQPDITSTCSASKSCSKKEGAGKPSEEDTDRTAGCNPFASCSGCQYVFNHKVVYFRAISPAIKVKLFTAGEDIQSGFISDCWHPPEAMLS
jgi:hypothetical protein